MGDLVEAVGSRLAGGGVVALSLPTGQGTDALAAVVDDAARRGRVVLVATQGASGTARERFPRATVVSLRSALADPPDADGLSLVVLDEQWREDGPRVRHLAETFRPVGVVEVLRDGRPSLVADATVRWGPDGPEVEEAAAPGVP